MIFGLWITGEDRLRKVAWTIHGHLHVIIKRQMVSRKVG
jgi:calcineurin-like phosphoesterase family protein